ncbi:MAG: NUDIX domain-containing protein [Candidatus Tectimicrobiota bacterium]
MPRAALPSVLSRRHPASQQVKVAVDNCIFTILEEQLQLLLIQMTKTPFVDQWALPGGLIEESESLDDAAARILAEETGVTEVYLEQLYTFGRPDRDPAGRVVSVAYFALIHAAGLHLRTQPKYADVRWWPCASLPALAYDHDAIAAYARQRLAWKLSYTNVVWSLLPRRFALTELQKVYEAVLGQPLDKRNFRKKVLSLDLIEPVGETARHGAHRPAMLYRFTSREPRIVDML